MPYRPAPDAAIVVLRWLGEELRRARYARRFSQAALAHHAGVAQSTVSMIERGAAPGLRLSRYALMLDTLARAPADDFRRFDRIDDIAAVVLQKRGNPSELRRSIVDDPWSIDPWSIPEVARGLRGAEEHPRPTGNR
jgi:transcriptional regulator with XRE-family HTH domain